MTDRFPYYIVRFKLSVNVPKTTTSLRFPYYIVRFKPRVECRRRTCYSLFPYYIVRFKLANLGRIIPIAIGFHTT